MSKTPFDKIWNRHVVTHSIMTRRGVTFNALSLALCMATSLCGLLMLADHRWQFSRCPSWKLSDWLVSLHERWMPPPAQLQEIVLVGIDSQTVLQMKERWPYSRATYARAIRQLKEAGARVIALDLSFFGESENEEEDAHLREVILEGQPVILGATLAEDGNVAFSTLAGLPVEAFSGLVNKAQDPDGVTRGAITYLMGTAAPTDSQRWIFSWELKLLEASGQVTLSSLEDQGDQLTLHGSGGTWTIPVDPVTKTFPIRFRAYSREFQRLSFYDVLKGEFDPSLIKNKIVLVGLLSEIFQDIHRTPIGWIPGVTLNANAFLTLYARDFLRSLPRAVELLALLSGVWLAVLIAAGLGNRLALVKLVALLWAFFAASLVLLSRGYTWNYALVPIGVITIPPSVRWVLRRWMDDRARKVGAVFRRVS